MKNPRISIVTPSLNQSKFIEQTINSVLNQHYLNLEYIIIDGGSTDGTQEIIKKYERHLKFWISEPDNGQSHAINKGLKYCTGEIFNWLNSDDYLENNALKNISDRFLLPDKPNLVAGEVEIFDENGTIEYVKHQNLSAKGLMFWEKGVSLVQPGVWMLRENIEKCGGIDEQFNYAFDWDLLIRYLYLFPNISFLPEKLINFRYHQKSKTVTSFQNFVTEEIKILEKIAILPEFKGLHNSCRKRIASNNWMPVLKEISESNATRINKIFKIISKHKYIFLPIWRATLGSIRQILLHGH